MPNKKKEVVTNDKLVSRKNMPLLSLIDKLTGNSNKDVFLPSDTKHDLLSAVEEFKQHLKNLGDDVHTTEYALNTTQPTIDVLLEKNGRIQEYIFNYCGLEVQHPAHRKSAANETKIDFTPLLMSSYKFSYAPVVLGALFLSFDEYLSSIEGKKAQLQRPVEIIGETNQVMKDFLVDNLGFHVVDESKDYDGNPIYRIRQSYDHLLDRYKAMKDSQDFDKLVQLIRKSTLRETLLHDKHRV